MKNRYLRTGVKFLLTALAAALASQIVLGLADARYDGRINQIAPVFGLAIAITLVGGYRFLPAIFIGAVLPRAFVESNFLVVLSEPVAAMAAAAISRWALSALKEVNISMERIRDTFLVLFFGAAVSTLLGALVQSIFLCVADTVFGWNAFGGLVLSIWLSAAVGTIILAPFIQTWSSPVDFRLEPRQALEVLVWFFTLIGFAHVTFQNWAPTDTLLYPMELAIFPIMSWASIRFGLRGTTAGVLALALLAGWELISVTAEGPQISQSPDNIWFFVGIVSMTSLSLASVMTEILRREARIAENESRLSAFTDALPDIALVLRENGLICDVFAATKKICANHRIFSTDSVRGKNIEEIFNKSVCEGVVETIERSLRNDKVATYEYSLQSVDVGEHWFEARVTPMSEITGEARQVVWVAYDISTRKAYEKAIENKDRVLKATALANNSLLTAGGFEKAVDAALFEMGKALAVDRAYVFEITGSANDEFHSFGIRHEWLRKDSLPSLHDNKSFVNAPFDQFCPGWYETLAQSGIVRLEYESCDPTGREVLELFRSRAILAIPMWKEGCLCGFFAVDHCHADHIWSETEVSAVSVLASSLSGLILIHEHEVYLRDAKELADAASMAKGEFLAMMSHEIRTPMNAIVGYTDLLLNSDLSDTQEDHASIIKRSGKALLDLINNILDYSKIESRSLELEAELFDLEQIVCEALEGILPQAKDKGLNLDYEISPEVKESYVGDAHRIRQVLINLSNNGIKFTRQGSVRVIVKMAEEQTDPDRDLLHFEVIDTGCGIPEEKFDRLFRAFSQVDSSTTRNYGGTGLGLAISKRLIERMDGRIWVESEVGVGSRFNFYLSLPYVTEGSDKEAPDAIDGESDGLEPDFASDYPLRVLFCEDDKANRWVIRELLETLGYRPDVVESGEEAIIQMRHHEYDAVLLDVRLPGRSGIELTEAVRSGDERMENTQQYIIALTAFAMNEDREKCLTAGMNDYIRKPVEILELKEALKRAYRNSLNSRS